MAREASNGRGRRIPGAHWLTGLTYWAVFQANESLWLKQKVDGRCLKKDLLKLSSDLHTCRYTHGEGGGTTRFLFSCEF